MVRGSVFLRVVFVLVMAAGAVELPCIAEEAEEETQEFIHITTYYPSPYGSYQELSSKILDFKTTDGPPDCVFGREKKGMLYFDEKKGLMYWDTYAKDWEEVAAGTGGDLLYEGLHTKSACVKAGGTVVSTDVGAKQCRFEASSCPAGWTPYKNYSETSEVNLTPSLSYTYYRCNRRNDYKSCYFNGVHWPTGQDVRDGISPAFVGDGCKLYVSSYHENVSGEGTFAHLVSCATDSHPWSNAERESCRCRYSSGYIDDDDVIYEGSAKIEAVGCY